LKENLFHKEFFLESKFFIHSEVLFTSMDLQSDNQVLNLRPYSSLKVLEAHGEKVVKLMKLNGRQKEMAFLPLRSKEISSMSKLLLQRRKAIAESSLSPERADSPPRLPRLADGLRKLNSLTNSEQPAHGVRKAESGQLNRNGDESSSSSSSSTSSAPLSSLSSSSSNINVSKSLSSSQNTNVASPPPQPLQTNLVTIQPYKSKVSRPFTSQWKSAVNDADHFQAESISNLMQIRNNSSNSVISSEMSTRSRSPMRGNISRMKQNPFENVPDTAVKRVGSSTKWTLGQLKSHYVWPHNVSALSVDHDRSIQRAYPPHEGHLYRIKTSASGSPIEHSEASMGFSPPTARSSIWSPKPFSTTSTNNQGSTGGFSSLSNFHSVATLDEDSDDDNDEEEEGGNRLKYYIHHEFGATFTVAESSLERKFLNACSEMWSDPGPPPPLAASLPQMEAVLQDVVDKIPLASLWNISTVEASTPIFSKDRQSVTNSDQIQPKVAAKIEDARKLLISPLVTRICIGLSHLAFWGILRPRMIAASRLRDDANANSQEVHSLLGLSQEDYHLTESNAPDQLQLVTAIVEEESTIDHLLSKQGMLGLSHTRPVLLLTLRACVESYLRFRFPNLFLLEHSLAEFLRRYPHAAKSSSQSLTSILLQSAPIHVQLDSLVASLFDPARIGSHVSSLESGQDTRSKLRTANIEMRRNMSSRKQDGVDNNNLDTVPLVLFPAKCRNVLHTTSAHVRAILTFPQDPKTRQFLSKGMKYIRGSQKLPKNTQDMMKEASFPMAPDGSLRISGTSAKSSQAALSLLSLKRAAGRYSVNGVPGELMSDGSRRPGTKGGVERLSILESLIGNDLSMQQMQTSLPENSLVSVLSGSFIGEGSSQFNDGFSTSEYDSLTYEGAMDHSLKLTASSLGVNDTSFSLNNSVRARLLSRKWPSEDDNKDETFEREVKVSVNTFDSDSGDEVTEQALSSSSSPQSRSDFVAHLQKLHHSAKSSALGYVSDGDVNSEIQGEREKNLTRSSLGLQEEASWIRKARERGPSKSVLNAIEYHEEVLKIEAAKKR
jgi:hypothetical protein